MTSIRRRCRAAARAGVEIAKGIHDLAAKAPIIITSLPHPSALHDTVAAIVAAKVKPRIVAEASTFTLEDKLNAERALRKAGHTMLDCPISGTGSQARVKDVVVYASGDSARSASSSRCSRDFRAACTSSAPSAIPAG